jgi:long-chain acyl-CoA synthetase
VTVEREPLTTGRIVAWLARQAEHALAEQDLSLPQFRVLILLAEGMALPSSMADSLDVRRPSVTAVVDGLVARGYVVREPDENDRRKVSHSLTDAGHRALEIADGLVEARLRSILGALDNEEQAAAATEGLERWGPALIAWRAKRHAEHAQQKADVRA